MSIIQQTMIERLRQVCQEDKHLVAAMLYGSFPKSEGDQFSDVECVLYFEKGALEEVDQKTWVGQIAPVELYFYNEWGTGTAIFDNLVRGEFHFHPASDMGEVKTWGDNTWFPSLEAPLLLDRTGELSRHLQVLVGPPPERDAPESVQNLAHCFINWTLFGSNVLARGEAAQALELLWWVQRYLLWMVRLLECTIEHWPTPTKALEEDISASTYARYVACTSKLDQEDLAQAYLAAWRWGKELMHSLADQYEIAIPVPLVEKLDSLLSERHRS